MKINEYDTQERVYLIAEIGNNHEGSLDTARKMVDAALEAEVDAVKFQIFRTEEYIAASNPDRFTRLKGFELTPDKFAQLADQTRAGGAHFIATPFDLASAKVAAELCDAIKIASGDNTFFPLIDTVAAAGKPTIMSTGLTDVKELREPYGRLAGALGDENLALLHCVTNYPVAPEDANVAAVKTLADQFACEIGYSDHTIGNDACLAAIACGARIIEKHFTLDHHFSDFRDHQLSANPAEMTELQQRIREFEILLGSGNKIACAAESELAPAVRRSIVTRQALPAGHVLSANDLTWIRPAAGMAPGRELELVGYPLHTAVEAGHQLQPDDVGQQQRD